MAIGVRDISRDTIVAIATPPGRSALAIIRVSGPDIQALGARVLVPWPIADRVPTLCTLQAPDGNVIDHPLATFFRGPASFTGEDLLEISTHGGFLVPALALRECLNAGAREALPGEFTRRAVLNGKLDILQAEAIGDLIDARTEALHHTAVLQLDGALSRVILSLRSQLIELEALISYDIDFPEEDDGPVPRVRILDASHRAIALLGDLVASAPTGELVREGAITVLAGRPNAGKSSLFNALIGQARAIVTDVPGTTRDAIEAVIEVQGWPVRLVDTAGLRPTSDNVERLGVEVSERYLAGAHLVLVCADEVRDLEAVRRRVSELSTASVIAVRTKADLVSKGVQTPSDAVAVSATARTGLDALLLRIRDVLTERYGGVLADRPLVTRARHLKALNEALAELEEFETAWRENALPAPVAAVHLRTARTTLEELVGAVDVDDVLDRVFSTFCIGK